MLKKTRLMIAATAIILLLVIFLPYSYRFYPSRFVENQTLEKNEDLLFTYEIVRYPSKVEIASPEAKDILVGITTDPWNLNFGIIPTGGSYGTRFINLGNMLDKEAKIKINAFGNITPLLDFSENNFILQKNETKTIDVYLYTKNTTQTGNYTGEVDVMILRPKYDFIYNLLWLF